MRFALKTCFKFSLIAALLAPGTAAIAAPGAPLFSSRCSMCHQSSGAGLSGQFPRVAGRVSQIATNAEGRRYLAMVLLFGMYGKIVVDGQTMSGLMPTMGSMSDQQIADVLNHVVSLQKAPKPVAAFTAVEIAAVRAAGKQTSAQVAAERTRLVAKKIIP